MLRAANGASWKTEWAFVIPATCLTMQRYVPLLCSHVPSTALNTKQRTISEAGIKQNAYEQGLTLDSAVCEPITCSEGLSNVQSTESPLLVAHGSFDGGPSGSLPEPKEYSIATPAPTPRRERRAENRPPAPQPKRKERASGNDALLNSKQHPRCIPWYRTPGRRIVCTTKIQPHRVQ